MSKESLIDDIKVDCDVARRSLDRSGWKVETGEGWQGWLADFGWAEGLSQGEIDRVEEGVLGKGEEKL